MSTLLTSFRKLNKLLDENNRLMSRVKWLVHDMSSFNSEGTLTWHDRGSPLLSSLVEENERCSKKTAELVSGMHFGIWSICTL